MPALVVFESLWGNTEQLARAIASGIGNNPDVVDSVSAPRSLPSDLDLLVVGAPTHAFSLSSEKTRESARQQGATHIPAVGVREWIDALTAQVRPIAVATFDTRVVTPRLPGSAAKKAMKRLVSLGFQAVVKPESFGVHGYSGPIAEGELERARRWGSELTQHLSRA